MEPDEQLAGCEAKLSRADEVLRDLDESIRSYLESEPYRVEAVIDMTTAALRVLVRVGEPPPLRLGVLAGDLVHNVRSALDHAVWQLAVAAGTEPTSKSQFPICDTEAAFEGEAKRGRLNGVEAEDRYRIWQMQPFNGDPVHGLHWLVALRELSNRDKHQVVLPTFAALSAEAAQRFQLKPGLGVARISDVRAIAGLPFRDGVDIVSAQLELLPGVVPEVTVEQPEAELDMGFSIDERRAITPNALREIRRCAGRLCEGFRAALEGRNPQPRR